VFYILRDLLHWLRCYYCETAGQLFPQFFPCTCRKNRVESQNDSYLFNGLDVLYQMQSFGEMELRAGRRCENVVFVCFFVSLSRSEAGALFVWGWHSLNKYCIQFKFIIISVAHWHCWLDFTIYSSIAYKFKNTSAILNVDTTETSLCGWSPYYMRPANVNKTKDTARPQGKLLPLTGRTDRQTDRQTECDAICGPLLRRRAA